MRNRSRSRFNSRSLAILLGFLLFSSLSFSVESSDASINSKRLLLTEYDATQNLDGWVMSEKLDGVRAYWDGSRLWSKTGKPIYAPQWFLNRLPTFKLDGELWIGRQRFAEVVSIVRDHKPSEQWHKVIYCIFDVPDQPRGLFERLALLETFLQKNPNPNLQVIAQVQIMDHQTISKELDRVTSLGGEGLVIRDAKEPYQTGRQSTIQKVKLKQDAECIVQGYTLGKGKYQGMVGALECALLDEQVERLFPKLINTNIKTIRVGSGLSDQQRQKPPKIGTVITFQYMGVTKNGLPRFPVFLRERVD